MTVTELLEDFERRQAISRDKEIAETIDHAFGHIERGCDVCDERSAFLAALREGGMDPSCGLSWLTAPFTHWPFRRPVSPIARLTTPSNSPCGAWVMVDDERFDCQEGDDHSGPHRYPSGPLVLWPQSWKVSGVA